MTRRRPQLYVENVFDHKYLLNGVFFSGASVGRPRWSWSPFRTFA
ncbi:MAG TPA: hypothetical protein VEM13_09535 [Gemmatimonadales bacterium]|nr:hypothetical protein [Gemmatimonadales bacterium]